MAAGRVMLRRLKELAHQGVRFAFETTLASRSVAPWLTALKHKGYAVHWCSCGCHRQTWPSSEWPTGW